MAAQNHKFRACCSGDILACEIYYTLCQPLLKALLNLVSVCLFCNRDRAAGVSSVKIGAFFSTAQKSCVGNFASPLLS